LKRLFFAFLHFQDNDAVLMSVLKPVDDLLLKLSIKDKLRGGENEKFIEIQITSSGLSCVYRIWRNRYVGADAPQACYQEKSRRQESDGPQTDNALLHGSERKHAARSNEQHA
jgi:hypothetical protein